MFLIFRVILKDKNYYLKSAVGIFLSWGAAILFTIYIYNPVGILAGYESGLDFPESKFDNNTVGIAIFAGWLSPTVVAIALYFEPKLRKYIFRNS